MFVDFMPIFYVSFQYRLERQIVRQYQMNSKHIKSIVPQLHQQKRKTKTSTQVLNLNRILQLTEQNQTCRIDDYPQQFVKQQDIKNPLFRCFGCIKRTCTLLFNRNKTTELDINQSQMSYMIDKIKNKKNGYQIVLPPLKDPKKTLVLDLDETLVYTTFQKPEFYDFETEIENKGKITKAYTIKRFGLDSFLFQMSQLYEIVVFTASQRKYGEKIIANLDRKGWISHKLYRQHTIVVNKTYFLKNLKILGRNIKDIIMVDDNRMGGILQPDNFYRIQPFMGSHKDRKLFRLSTFLKHIHSFSDVRPISGYRKKYEQMEIKLKENNSQTSTNCETKRKKYNHKKRTSEIQSLVQTQNTEQSIEDQKTNTCLIIR